MQGYDLQDTLVHINYTTGSLVHNIAQAKKLYTPTGPFTLITAQSGSPVIHQAIRAMVRDLYPNMSQIVFVTGANIPRKKADAIKRYKLTSYTDNNMDILRGIYAELGSSVDLFVMRNGSKVKVSF